MKVKINKEEGSKIEIEVTMPWADFEKFWDKGFKKIQDMAEVDGFRKGMAPKEMIISKYGEMSILEVMADEAINETYPKVILENKLKIITHPHVHVVKLARGEEFVYHAHVEVMPEINLPDYKKIAKDISSKKIDVNVTDEDISKILEDLRKMRASKNEAGEEVLPALDDDFAKSFAEEFTSLEVMKNKIRENAKLEKEQAEKEKLRSQLLEKLESETKAEIPESLVNIEIEKMLSQTRADIEKFGGKFEDYLAHIQKTEEDLRNEFKSMAAKRAASQVIIFEIAKKEDIKPTEEEIETEAVKILSVYKDANEANVRAYCEQILINEKVLQFLGV